MNVDATAGQVQKRIVSINLVIWSYVTAIDPGYASVEVTWSFIWIIWTQRSIL